MSTITGKELLRKLAKHKELHDLKNLDGSLRAGVLRGILNKLDTQPVQNLGRKKENGRVYYFYSKNNFTEMNNLIHEFLHEVFKRNLLQFNLGEVSSNELLYLKKVKEAINIFKEANKLLKLTKFEGGEKSFKFLGRYD